MTPNSIFLAGTFCDEYLKPVFEEYGRNILTQLATRQALINELTAFGQKFADEHGIKAGFYCGEPGNTGFPYDLIIYDKEKDRRNGGNVFIWPIVEEAEKYMIAGIGIFTQAEDRLYRFMDAKAREKQHKNPKLRFAAFHLSPELPVDTNFGTRGLMAECTYSPRVHSVRKYLVYPAMYGFPRPDPDIMEKFFEWVFSGYTGGKEEEAKKVKEVKEVKETRELKEVSEEKETKKETGQKKAS